VTATPDATGQPGAHSPAPPRRSRRGCCGLPGAQAGHPVDQLLRGDRLVSDPRLDLGLPGDQRFGPRRPRALYQLPCRRHRRHRRCPISVRILRRLARLSSGRGAQLAREALDLRRWSIAARCPSRRRQTLETMGLVSPAPLRASARAGPAPRPGAAAGRVHHRPRLPEAANRGRPCRSAKKAAPARARACGER
jgi:hypothetical protein